MYVLTGLAVRDNAQVLKSLQKPRKISILGSDGKNYNILCKPKDDLRKDQRLMEFNNMINRFLKRNVEASKRRMCKFSSMYFFLYLFFAVLIYGLRKISKLMR